MTDKMAPAASVDWLHSIIWDTIGALQQADNEKMNENATAVSA